MGERNVAFEAAMKRTPSPSGRPRPISRAEVAEEANRLVFKATDKLIAMNEHSVGKIVRGETTWPAEHTRNALCQVLGVESPSEIGLFKDRRHNAATAAKQPSERLGFVLRNPASTDLVVAAHLHERVRQLGEFYDHASSTSLTGPVGRVHVQVQFLRERATDPRVKRALYEVEADSATLMSQLVWDASQRRDHRAPLTYLDEAVAAARHSRDVATEAYAVLRKGFIALYGAKKPDRGRELAEQAATIARFDSPALTGLSLLHVAEAHAMTNHLTDCESALKQAESQFDRVGPDDVAAPYFTVNEYNRLAGSCYLFLGQPKRAEPILRTTVAALATKQKSQAIALGNLTLALIRQRKLDEAAATMHRTIDVVERTRGGGGLNVVFSAGRELRQWRHEPWAEEINERLLAMMAAI